jgi:hypothetical protein
LVVANILKKRLKALQKPIVVFVNLRQSKII